MFSLCSLCQSSEPITRQQHLKLDLLNSCSLNNRNQILNEFVMDNNLNLICLTETWHIPLHYFSLNQTTPPNFTYIEKAKHRKNNLHLYSDVPSFENSVNHITKNNVVEEEREFFCFSSLKILPYSTDHSPVPSSQSDLITVQASSTVDLYFIFQSPQYKSIQAELSHSSSNAHLLPHRPPELSTQTCP